MVLGVRIELHLRHVPSTGATTKDENIKVRMTQPSKGTPRHFRESWF